MDYANAMRQYQAMNAETAVSGADPHRLISLMMQRTRDRIAAAKGHILRNETALKGTAIGDAISIIDGLRMSLDKSRGGDIAQNLEDLYDYMQRRLIEANLRSNPEVLDEIKGLMDQIQDAWNAIPPDVKGNPADSR